jgi:hypothetical protein
MGIGSATSDNGRIGMIASPDTGARIDSDKRASTINFDLPIFAISEKAKI